MKLTGRSRERVARALSALAEPSIAVITPEDFWMPQGLDMPEEAKLGQHEPFLTSETRESLTQWWLEVPRNANTPNWDIASTCRVSGRKGLLLIEAKAHSNELSSLGKSSPRSRNGWKNHEKVATAISEANDALNRIAPGWSLSRDSHYQLSNRFAWAWKLTSLKVPVVLVYLGFLDANEMDDQGQPFASPSAWENCIRAHAHGVVPDSVCGNMLDIAGTPFWPLIRTA
ncbi:MAG: hypothetical protein FJ039_06560 [Chloroflexi bacterium]|nr:hypothetical protein [Chloroflexota bacterium]